MVEAECGVELRVLGQQPQLNGEEFLDYWLWKCRTDQMDWSVHPVRKFNPAELDYVGNLTETQKWPTTETEKKY